MEAESDTKFYMKSKMKEFVCLPTYMNAFVHTDCILQLEALKSKVCNNVKFENSTDMFWRSIISVKSLLIVDLIA